jgi:hypothetical protein
MQSDCRAGRFVIGKLECLNALCSKVHIDTHLCDKFPIQNGLKQGCAYDCCFSAALYNNSLRRSKKTRRGGQ